MKRILYLLLASLIFVLPIQAKDMKFVQISEVEFSSVGTNNELKNVIKEVNDQKDVEFVVFTGDNIIKPSLVELRAFLKTIKKLKAPYYVLIGEKDVNKLKDCSKADYAKLLKKKIFRYKPDNFNYSFEKDDLIFIVVDGSKEIVNTPNGYYKLETLEWLDQELSKFNDKNIIILQHFPIIPPANRKSYVTIKTEGYLEVIAKHKNIKAIVAGHFGVNSEKIINGVSHITTAGVPYYRVIDVIDYETENPIIWAQLQKAN